MAASSVFAGSLSDLPLVLTGPGGDYARGWTVRNTTPASAPLNPSTGPSFEAAVSIAHESQNVRAIRRSRVRRWLRVHFRMTVAVLKAIGGATRDVLRPYVPEMVPVELPRERAYHSHPELAASDCEIVESMARDARANIGPLLLLGPKGLHGRPWPTKFMEESHGSPSPQARRPGHKFNEEGNRAESQVPRRQGDAPRHAAPSRNPDLHSGLHPQEWLFPNLRRDRGPIRYLKGDGLRTPHHPRRKRPPQPREAQGSLFAPVEPSRAAG